MSERELDSSINDYIETETPKNYVKQLQWDMAIGLQEVDNLKPSKYLEKLLQENVTGEKTIYEVEHELKQYYVEKDKTDKTIHDEFECDLVSTRIVQLLEEDNFELSVDYIKYIHEYLFKDVYEFAGEFRKGRKRPALAAPYFRKTKLPLRPNLAAHRRRWGQGGLVSQGGQPMKRILCLILITLILLSGCSFGREQLKEPVTFYYLRQYDTQESYDSFFSEGAIGEAGDDTELFHVAD